MGSLGFDDFKAQVQYRMGQDTAPESVGSDSLNYYGIWVNKAYRQICTSHKLYTIPKRFYFPELETSTTATTTDGTAYVSVPSDALVIRTVFDSTNSTKLTYIPWRTYLAYTDRATAASEGDATEWTRASGRIYLHPTPSTTGDTMTIYYKKVPADLSGSDTTAIGEEWDEPVVILAAHKGFMWTGDFEKAKMAKEEFIEIVMGLASVYDTEEIDRDATWEPSSSYMPGT